MSKYIGTIRTSSNSGDYEVLGRAEGFYHFLIRFLNTGHTQVVRGTTIVSGQIHDKSTPKKKEASRFGPGSFHQTTYYGFLEITAMGEDNKRLVRFLDTGVESVTTIQQIAKGTAKDPTLPRFVTKELALKRAKGNIKVSEGQIFKTNNGLEYTVIKVIQSKQIRIRFTITGFERDTTCKAIRDGEIKDVMSPTVYGVGCLGTLDKMHPQVYSVWKAMIQRVHGCKGYEDVTIHTPWYNYSTFLTDVVNLPNYSKWLEEGGKYWHFDKDILCPGIRHYGPETVCFVHAEDNSCDAMVRKMIKRYEIGNPMHTHLSSVLQALRDKYRTVGCIYPTPEDYTLYSFKDHSDKLT